MVDFLSSTELAKSKLMHVRTNGLGCWFVNKKATMNNWFARFALPLSSECPKGHLKTEIPCLLSMKYPI